MTIKAAAWIRACSAGEAALKILGSEAFDVVVGDDGLGEGRGGPQVWEEVRHLGCLGHASRDFLASAELTGEGLLRVSDSTAFEGTTLKS